MTFKTDQLNKKNNDNDVQQYHRILLPLLNANKGALIGLLRFKGALIGFLRFNRFSLLSF